MTEIVVKIAERPNTVTEGVPGFAFMKTRERITDKGGSAKNKTDNRLFLKGSVIR